jgi:hypothetical protein
MRFGSPTPAASSKTAAAGALLVRLVEISPRALGDQHTTTTWSIATRISIARRASILPAHPRNLSDSMKCFRVPAPARPRNTRFLTRRTYSVPRFANRFSSSAHPRTTLTCRATASSAFS